jgi:DNA-binding NtrC family response regulator
MSQEDQTVYSTNKIYTIIVIDDDESLRYLLQQILRSKFKIYLCSNEYEAYDIFYQKSEIFNLIITDYHLLGVKGLEIIQNFREIIHIPAIIITGDPTIDSIELNDIDVLHKPFSINNLKELVNKHTYDKQRK